MVISGEKFSRYMGLDAMEAEHVTLIVPGTAPPTEVQILKYHQPSPPVDPTIANLGRLGYNHMCFAVDNLDAALRQLGAVGFEARGDARDFRGRKLVFVSGPEGITVELSERDAGASG